MTKEERRIVATYANELDAELAKATLSAAGIESYIRIDDIGGMVPSLQESEGIKLFVHPDRLDEARALLSETATTRE
jgi:hypothetical protein